MTWLMEIIGWLAVHVLLPLRDGISDLWQRWGRPAWTYIAINAYHVDLLLNSIFGGKKLQTVSARWGESPTKVWLWYWGCKLLNWFELRHCEKSRERYDKLKAFTE